ncbi:MAG: GNAT family N-acetyltransferase [Rhizobiales bacterium]|nr:GNAT family N-acetyltransferase [Hyphomicrobiales bacterium]
MPIRQFTAETVPIIETARLKLRRHEIADFDACAAMWGDPAIARFIGGRPFTREEVWARILRYVGHWSLKGYGYWAIEDRQTGQFIGEIGLADFKRDLDPPLGDGPEAGWALRVASHGKGYAEEALRAVLAWGDEHFKGETIHCLIEYGNDASIRLAGKCGFRPLREVTYKGTAGVVYGRAIPSPFPSLRNGPLSSPASGRGRKRC